MATNAAAPSVTIEQQRRLPTVVIRTTCAPDRLAEAIDQVYGELMPLLSPTQVLGAPFIRYFQMDDTIVDFEGGVVVRGPVATTDRLRESELPDGPAAVTLHTGPYDRLCDAYDVLNTWLAVGEWERSGPSWEVYLTDPREERDPSKWQTRIVIPIRRKGS